MIGRAGRVALWSRAGGLAVAGLAALAAPAVGQRPRIISSPPDAAKVLVVPFARDNADSGLAVTMTDGLRDRLRLTRANIFNVIPKPIINENLVASGFGQDVPLEPNVARQLARFLNARVLIEGSIARGPGDSLVLTARLAEQTGLAPQSATARLVVARARGNGSAGAELGNRLADAYRSFEHVQNCRRFLEQRDHARALEAANRALQQHPRSAGAHLCVAQITRAQGGGTDSVLSSLLRADDGDSLNSVVLRQLARIYEERRDTTRLLGTLHRLLFVDAGDNDLRVSAARLFVVRNQTDSAVALLDEGLARNPSQVELLNAKSIALAAASRWAEAAATLTQVSELDTASVDSLFLLRITTYFQQVPDSTRLLEWTRTATRRLPRHPPYWFALGTLLYARADTAGALEAIHQFLALQPTDGRGHVVYASYLLGAGQVDSALAHAGLAAAADSTLRNSAASVYLSGGVRALQPPPDFALAAERLRAAKGYATGRTLVTVSWFLGIARIQLAVAADTDASTNRNCESARRAGEFITAAEQDILAGVAQDRERANQFLTQVIPAYKQRSEAMQRNFCR